MTVQRTKVYQTAFDIQRGFLVGISYKRAATRRKSSVRRTSTGSQPDGRLR